MPNPTKISDLPASNPIEGEFIPVGRVTTNSPGTYKIRAENIVAQMLNVENTSTINMSFNTGTRTLKADAALIPTANGGTGLTTTPQNGQVLIGNGTGYSLNTITAGSNITVENGPGTIKINSTTINVSDHPGVAKAYVDFWLGTGPTFDIRTSYNVSGIEYLGYLHNGYTFKIFLATPMKTRDYTVYIGDYSSYSSLENSSGQTYSYSPNPPYGNQTLDSFVVRADGAYWTGSRMRAMVFEV